MSAPLLKIREELAAQIRAHGVETYPYECCGAILGRDGASEREVLALVPLANRRNDSPRNRFEVTPGDVQLARKPRAKKISSLSAAIIRIPMPLLAPANSIANMRGLGTATSSSACNPASRAI